MKFYFNISECLYLLLKLLIKFVKNHADQQFTFSLVYPELEIYNYTHISIISS
jgi:hypothetical protein